MRDNWPLFSLPFILILPLACQAIQAPYQVQATQIWPSDVQVLWMYNDVKGVTFVTQYRPVTPPLYKKWQEQEVKEDHVMTLTGLRAHTNYSIRVIAMKGSNLMISNTVYVHVRDGVPYPPYNLTQARKKGDNATLKISWKVEDFDSVEGFHIEVSTPNETYSIPTTQTKYNLKNIGLESGWTIRIYSVNKYGPSQPAILQFHSPSQPENRRDATPGSVDIDPKRSNDILIYVIAVIGGLILVVLVVATVLLLRRRHTSEPRNALPNDVRSHEPFIRHSRRCEPDGSDIQLQGYYRQHYNPQEGSTLQGSHHQGATFLPESGGTGIYPAPHSLTAQVAYSHTSGPFYSDGFSHNPGGPFFPLPKGSPSPLRQVRDMAGPSQYRTGGSSPRSDMTPSSSWELQDLQDSPKLGSKRRPIIPIQPDDRLYSNVDVTKYQLKPERLSYPYEAEESACSASGGSHVYAMIPSL